MNVQNPTVKAIKQAIPWSAIQKQLQSTKEAEVGEFPFAPSRDAAQSLLLENAAAFQSNTKTTSTARPCAILQPGRQVLTDDIPHQFIEDQACV